MDTIITPNMDFQTAGTQPARLGYRGEISDAIEQGMSVYALTQLHHSNYKFSGTPTVHDSRHVVPLGLLTKTHPHLMAGNEYQLGSWSEAYATASNEYIMFPDMNRARFIESVQRLWEEDAIHENERRVLAWLVSRATGEDINGLKMADAPELRERAKAIGMTINYDNEEKDTKHVVISRELGSFTATRDGIEFSQYFPGQEDITPFKRPSDDEAGAMFDAMEPALNLLREKGRFPYYEPASVLSHIPVAGIIECMQSGIAREAKPDVTRGAHVQPS